MGKSTSSSCFKIITCATDSSADQDHLHQQPSQSKSSSDKRGWSFRKRSSRQRSTLITETPSSGNKESPESAALKFQTTAGASVSEKIVLPWPDEKPQLPTPVELNVPEAINATKESTNKVDVPVDESLVISIQAAIKGFLARRAFVRLKKLVKLQAAVRGHLVRRHAVGTLRCVQAIIKMQALVRARHTRLSLERSSKEEMEVKLNETANQSSESKDKIAPTTKPAVTYTSIEKLLRNSFARRLMESTPKNQPIYIKCDSLGQDSSWKWLERWMSVSSPDLAESMRPDLSTDDKESENVAKSFPPRETEISSEVCESENLKSSAREIPVTPTLSEQTSSELKDNLEQPQPEIIDKSTVENLPDSSSIQNHASNSEIVFSSLSGHHDAEQPQHSMNASERLESGGKLARSVSGKASNPAIMAAHSKYDELSSTPSSGIVNSSSSQVIGFDSNIDEVSSGSEVVNGTKEPELVESSVLHYSSLPVGGSDCGTELSITSTLDSPDRFDSGDIEFDRKSKVSKEEGTYIVAETGTGTEAEALDVDAKETPIISDSNLSDPASFEPEIAGGVTSKAIDPVASESFEQIEQNAERSPTNFQVDLDSATSHVAAYKSSPELSPRSHITVPESQGTPSSLVSTSAKQAKTDRSGSIHKRKSKSAVKRSPSSALHDTGARDSVETLSNDQKSAKRRTSFGSVKQNNVDQEPRNSSSSSSLPNYMQATESARAKVNANNSPRSSPDVQDRELYTKKRHSLPGSNGRQGSPHIQRSLSQAQPGAKGNTQPHERKWQR